ncbi:MAG: oligosaccharide flippase family protein [Bacteroidota bacterium]
MRVLHSIKEIAKDMSIYGVSTLLGQIISFFLLPLYTSYLSPEDYGILSLVTIFSGGYRIVSNFGISSAIFRFAGMADSKSEKLAYLDTSQYINVFLNVIFIGLTVPFSSVLAEFLFDSTGYEDYLLFAIFLGCVGSISSIPLSYLRIQRKTIFIAYSSLINLFVTITCTIIGLTIMGWGIWGALIGNVCGNIISLLYLLWQVNLPKWKLFSVDRVKALMAYALPMLPHKVFGFLLPIVSQVLLIRYLTLEDLGIYNISYKFCMPLFIFIKLFQKSYSPYRFEILKEKEHSKSLFVEINLIYMIIISIGYVFLVFFGDDFIKLLTSFEFHIAGEYLLFMALIPVSQGLYFMFGTGVEFSKSPKFLPLISGLGFFITLIGSIFLVPKLGIDGAAIAPVLGWLAMAFFVFQYAQRIYKIPYAWGKYTWIILLTSILLLLNRFSNHNSFLIDALLFLGYLFFLLGAYKEIVYALKEKIILKIKS